MADSNRLMIWDLDGTLYHSDAIYRFFAKKIAEGLDPANADKFLEEIEGYLQVAETTQYSSDWEALLGIARPYLPADPLQVAQVMRPVSGQLRQYLLSDGCQLHLSQTVRDFLWEVRDRVHLAVVTNGPATTVEPLLVKLGVRDYFDYVHAEAGKPDGLIGAARAALGIVPVEQVRIISVGDSYANDMAPALAQGWEGALVAGRHVPPGPVTYMAKTVQQLVPFLQHWLNAT